MLGKGRTIRSTEIQAEYWGGKGKKQSNSYRVDKVALEVLKSQISSYIKLDKHQKRENSLLVLSLQKLNRKNYCKHSGEINIVLSSTL